MRGRAVIRTTKSLGKLSADSRQSQKDPADLVMPASWSTTLRTPQPPKRHSAFQVADAQCGWWRWAGAETRGQPVHL